MRPFQLHSKVASHHSILDRTGGMQYLMLTKSRRNPEPRLQQSHHFTAGGWSGWLEPPIGRLRSQLVHLLHSRRKHALPPLNRPPTFPTAESSLARRLAPIRSLFLPSRCADMIDRLPPNDPISPFRWTSSRLCSLS